MFQIKDVSVENFDLKIVQSDIFPPEVVHLFSTRVGGDTPKPLDSFTMSAKDYLVYDDFAQKNIEIICSYLNADKSKLLQPNQQHTDDIAVIRCENDVMLLQDKPFDGIVTSLKNIPILLVFADCIPVLIYDTKNKVVAAVHAGWKGTAKKIAPKAVGIMKEIFSSTVEDLVVAIGAGIGQECFEVNKDVSSQLGMSIKNSYGNIFLENEDKVQVDLKLLNKIQLQELGIGEIDICEYCTCCNNKLFYSYRADNKLTGRHGMFVMIKE